MTAPYLIGSGNNNTAATTGTVTTSQGTTSGDKVLVAVSAPAAVSGSITVTDSSFNNYVIVSNPASPAALFVFESTGKTNYMPSSTTVTITFGASSTFSAVVIGVGEVMYQLVDVQAAASGTSTAPAVSTATPTHYGTGGQSIAIVQNTTASAPSSWGHGFTQIGASGAATPGNIAVANLPWTGNSLVTASATLGSSVAWGAIVINLVYTLWPLGTVPALTTIPAGYIVQPSDMNAMSQAAAFLLNKPIARVVDTLGTQSIGSGGANIAFGAATIDTDGMWNADITTTALTIQTPGFYKIRYVVHDRGTSFNTYLTSTTGSNNPGGANVTSTAQWGAWAYGVAASANAGAGCSGLWPYYLYPGDTISVYAIYAGGTTVLLVNSDTFSYLTLEWMGA